MKKYIIGATIALSVVSLVSAEDMPKKGMASGSASSMPHIMMPAITTGDATVDAQIKTLQTEMEAKIKAIREEYQAKIKVAIGDRKASLKNGMGSSTMPMTKGDGRQGKGEGDERGRGIMMRGSTTPMRHEGEMMHGSSTEGGYGVMRKEGGNIPNSAQVKGEQTGGNGNEGGVRGFFGKFFGR